MDARTRAQMFMRKLLGGVVFLAIALVTKGATFTVSTTADSGAGSLRQAITDANSTPGADTITFSIAGSGVQTITVSSALPTITESVIIDATTQAGYSGTPLIDLNGNFGAGRNGFFINTSDCAIRGFVIRNFGSTTTTGRACGILLSNAFGNTIEGCYVGIAADGTAANRNSLDGIRLIDSGNNTIGGTSANQRNVVSGNSRNGIFIFGTNATNNVLQGNYISINPAGTATLNNSDYGILVSNATFTVIGGTSAGARNVIATGGSLANIQLINGASSTVIQGNYIGTKADGTAISTTAASARGVEIRSSSNNRIGGIVSGAPNVISGTYEAVLIINADSTNNFVEGNLIGTDPTGTTGLTNTFGVTISTGASGNYVGGTNTNARNIISANQNNGVSINDASGNFVQGNYIGTDVTGNVRLGNTKAGTQGSGVSISSTSLPATNNIVGGASTAMRNIISGNNDTGVRISGPSATGNYVQGNFIGVALNGAAMGNAKRGVNTLGANYNVIGGSAEGQGNIIANNGLDGVWLAATFGATGIIGTNNVVQGNTIYSNAYAVVGGYAAGITLLGANTISSNSIYGNAGMGIDRGGDGPTANTSGGRNNTPLLVTVKQGSTIVDGTLDGDLLYTYDVEFYANPASDASPQAKTYLGKLAGLSPGNFHVEYAAATPIGDTVTAIATSSSGPIVETSEICPGIAVAAGVGNGGPSSLSAYNGFFFGTVGHPISTFTGELFDLLPVDLVINGPMPLVFQRYYASLLKSDGKIAGALGDNWLHTYEMTLHNSNTVVEVVNNRGRVLTFTNNAGNYTLLGKREVPFQLVQTNATFILADPTLRRLFTFDAAGKLTKVEDGKGNAHTLSYNGNLLNTVSDGLGGMFTFSYSAGGQLTNVTDGARSVGFVQTGNNLTGSRSPLGFVTAYTYDAGGLMTAMTYPEGNTPFTQVFDGNGRVSVQAESGTNLWRLGYNGSTTAVTNPLGAVATDSHTISGELSRYTDEAGQAVAITSNSDGQRASIGDRLGNATRFAYHAASGRVAAITNADGAVTLFSYGGRNVKGLTFYDLTSVQFPDGTTETFSYDASGNLLSRTNRGGKVFSFSYNTRGQLLAATNPAGGVLSFTYNPDGTCATRADSDTGPTVFQYDSLKRLTNVLHPDGSSISARYDADDRLLSITDERNAKISFRYDQNGRVSFITNALGGVTQFAYDQHDRVVRRIDRLGKSLGFRFNELGQLASVTNRNGYVTQFGYDVRRRLTLITDPGNQAWRYDYNNEGALASFANPLNQTNRIGRDKLGFAVAFTNALSQTANVLRDTQDRITSATDPFGRVRAFNYDTRGLLTNISLPLIGSAGYERNALGRVQTVTGFNGEQWQFGYTAMGRVKTVADPFSRTTTFGRDNRGRIATISYPDSCVRTNGYDAAGNLTRAYHNLGPDLLYAYDALGRLTNAAQLSFSYDAENRVTNTVSSGVNFGATYDDDGRLTSVSFNNGAFSVNYSYDNRDRLIHVTDTLSAAQMDFGYDDAGRLTSVTRGNAVNGTYTYDAAGRLTRIQEGNIIDIQYGLNAAGEVTNANVIAPLDIANFLPITNQAFTFDAAHQIKNGAYAYDPRGRLVSAPGHAFAWDGASRLTAIDGVTLTYNGVNDVLTRTAGSTTRYFYNHAVRMHPIMAEKTEGGAFQRFYIWSPGGRLLYLIDVGQGNAVRYFHFDKVGSTLALTSAAGIVLDAYAYSPYGALLTHSGTSVQPFTFVGAFGVRSEPAADVYQMRARYFDPLTARFLTRDPVWPRLTSPLSLDPYTYAEENPLLHSDPSGLFPTDGLNTAFPVGEATIAGLDNDFNFGFSFRAQPVTTSDFWEAGGGEIAQTGEAPISYYSNDGMTAGNLTIDLGLRFDRQVTPMPSIVPREPVSPYPRVGNPGQNLFITPFSLGAEVLELNFAANVLPQTDSAAKFGSAAIGDNYFSFYTGVSLNQRFHASAKVYTYEEEEDRSTPRPPAKRRSRPVPIEGPPDLPPPSVESVD